MSKQLRPYQVTFLNDVRQAVAKYKKVVAVMATGAGKTVCFVDIATKAIAKGRTVLLISESTKIFKQISKEIKSIEINAGSTLTFLRKNYVYLAMAQTLQRREKLIQNFNHFGDNLLIIVDEAHVGTPTKLLLQIPNAYSIGVTATPAWQWAKHLPLLYNACVVGPQPDELVNEGFLSPYRHFARVSADLDQLALKNGEFTEESQEKVFESRKVYDGLMDDLRKIPYVKCAIFCASIKDCEHTVATLKANGFKAVHVHSKLSDQEQSFNLGQFSSGAINIMVSVGSLTKGWDEVLIDLVVIKRATTSLPLYLQMIGRGSRIAPGKNSFTVLDYGGNYQRHGLWDAERDWSSMWQEQPKRKKAPSAAPVKLCPKCEYINPVSAITCKNCAHTFTKSAAQQQEETRLIEVNAAYRAMVGRKLSDLSPQELAIYARLKNKKGHAARVAKAQEQKQPGFLQAYCQAIGYKMQWVHFQTKTITQEPIEFFDTILK